MVALICTIFYDHTLVLNQPAAIDEVGQGKSQFSAL